MITERHLNDTYGYPADMWNKAKQEARDVLVDSARRKKLITYGELLEQIEAIKFQDPHDTIFHRMLGQLSWEEDAGNRGMITAIVVHKGDQTPGDGFWRLADELGRDTSDKWKFWS